jgi:hypothetical protein
MHTKAGLALAMMLAMCPQAASAFPMKVEPRDPTPEELKQAMERMEKAEAKRKRKAQLRVRNAATSSEQTE